MGGGEPGNSCSELEGCNAVVSSKVLEIVEGRDVGSGSSIRLKIEDDGCVEGCSSTETGKAEFGEVERGSTVLLETLDGGGVDR